MYVCRLVIQTGDFSRQHRLPLPPLCFQQLKRTLTELAVEVVQCEEEADQQIAIDCAEENYYSSTTSSSSSGNEVCFCLAQDRYLILRNFLVSYHTFVPTYFLIIFYYNLYVCTYVCMFVCMYVCMYVCTNT